MERLKNMKETLVSCVQSQIGGRLNEVESKELGEAIDMIKDLSEAIYYCTITESMEGKEKQGQQKEVMYYPVYMRDMDREEGRMYYNGGNSGNSSSSGGNSSSGNNASSAYYGGYAQSNYARGGQGNSGGGSRNYPMQEEMYPREIMRDYREGKSPMSRKNYMESKEMHKGKEMQMKELEKYLQELSQDVTEMIEGASPEEKQVLKQKVSMLANKIQ